VYWGQGKPSTRSGAEDASAGWGVALFAGVWYADGFFICLISDRLPIRISGRGRINLSAIHDPDDDSNVQRKAACSKTGLLHFAF
jgi:hypothetical protein